MLGNGKAKEDDASSGNLGSVAEISIETGRTEVVRDCPNGRITRQ